MNTIALNREIEFPVLFENRSCLAIDKPRGWILAPDTWDRTGRNLQLALASAIQGGAPWARSRRIKYLRYVHRLDSETSGVLLLAKSSGALKQYSERFRRREIGKAYLAVVCGRPAKSEWTCTARLEPDLNAPGKMRTSLRTGEQAETRFRLVASVGNLSLIEAEPITGRTHQIRVHLAWDRLPIVNDRLYGMMSNAIPIGVGMGLRAVGLSFDDPFEHRPIRVIAPFGQFLADYGFAADAWTDRGWSRPRRSRPSEEPTNR